MTIHNFCKEVFEGNYFMMRSQIDDQMISIVREEDDLDWADARDKQLEVLNELEIDVTDEDEFQAGEVSICFDYDAVSAVEDWAEEQGHCLSLGTYEWEQYDSEINDVLKCILVNNQLITPSEWAIIEDDFYALIMDGYETDITRREIGDVNFDLSEGYFENPNLETILSSVIAGRTYSDWDQMVSEEEEISIT